jgi:hypothetical protein
MTLATAAVARSTRSATGLDVEAQAFSGWSEALLNRSETRMGDFQKPPGYVALPREPLFIAKGKGSSSSAFFVVALILAVISIGATIKNNQEILGRRLNMPVPSTAVLQSANCTSFARAGGFQKPIAILEYQYRQGGVSDRTHMVKTSQWFDTSQECENFKNSASKTRTIWYEKAEPAKASLHLDEPLSWGFLWGLLAAAFFLYLSFRAKKSGQGRRATEKAR